MPEMILSSWGHEMTEAEQYSMHRSCTMPSLVKIIWGRTKNKIKSMFWTWDVLVLNE